MENSRRRNIMMDEASRADPPNWIQQHVVYQDLMRFNVGDSAQVHAAFLVYMDLTEVRGWSGVAGVSCPELQAVLLEAREKEGDTVQMIYPLPSHRSIKHRELRCILDRGAPMLLCSVASDSSLVYQRLCDGFLTPDPQWTSKTKAVDSIAAEVADVKRTSRSSLNKYTASCY